MFLDWDFLHNLEVLIIILNKKKFNGNNMNVTNNGINLQNYLFALIKNQLPVNISLVNKIAELLEISNDSAYRRLRCETLLNIGEVMLLCNHFKLSIDALNTQLSNITRPRR
jgi:hypothetical protein